MFSFPWFNFPLCIYLSHSSSSSFCPPLPLLNFFLQLSFKPFFLLPIHVPRLSLSSSTVPPFLVAFRFAISHLVYFFLSSPSLFISIILISSYLTLFPFPSFFTFVLFLYITTCFTCPPVNPFPPPLLFIPSFSVMFSLSSYLCCYFHIPLLSSFSAIFLIPLCLSFSLCLFLSLPSSLHLILSLPPLGWHQSDASLSSPIIVPISRRSAH